MTNKLRALATYNKKSKTLLTDVKLQFGEPINTRVSKDSCNAFDGYAAKYYEDYVLTYAHVEVQITKNTKTGVFCMSGVFPREITPGTPTTSCAIEFSRPSKIGEPIPAGTFTGGTLNLTVDGLFQEAEQMIMGLPAPDTESDWLDYDEDQEVPYVGVGYIARYQSEGVTTFCPTIIVKAQFNQLQNSHATSEEQKNYQTQALSAAILRGDDTKHKWKRVAKEDYATEAEAEAAIKTALNIASGG